MLTFLNFLAEKVLGQILERTDLTELILVLGELSQVSDLSILGFSFVPSKHSEIVIQTVASDDFVFENFMSLLLRFLECNSSVFSL